MSAPVEAREHRPVAGGASLGRFKVASSTPNRLVLKEPRWFFRLVIGLGLLCTAAGVGAAGWYLREARQEIPLKLLGVPLAGPVVVLIGAGLLYRRRVFDGRRRAMVTRGLFWRSSVVPWDSFKHVQVRVKNAEGRQPEMVEVVLERPAGTGGPLVIGSLRTTRKALSLVWAADEISRLLDLPLRVSGDCQEGASEVCRALETLERYKPMVRAA